MSVHARAAIGNSFGALSQGTVGALSGHCQGTIRALSNTWELVFLQNALSLQLFGYKALDIWSCWCFGCPSAQRIVFTDWVLIYFNISRLGEMSWGSICLGATILLCLYGPKSFCEPPTNLKYYSPQSQTGEGCSFGFVGLA